MSPGMSTVVLLKAPLLKNLRTVIRTQSKQVQAQAYVKVMQLPAEVVNITLYIRDLYISLTPYIKSLRAMTTVSLKPHKNDYQSTTHFDLLTYLKTSYTAHFKHFESITITETSLSPTDSKI